MSRSEEPTAIDFVEMYADRIEKEDEFDKVDDMLRAAAVLTVKSDEILNEIVRNTPPTGPFPMHEAGG